MNDMSDGWVRALVDTATSMEHDGTFAGYTEMFQKLLADTSISTAIHDSQYMETPDPNVPRPPPPKQMNICHLPKDPPIDPYLERIGYYGKGKKD